MRRDADLLDDAAVTMLAVLLAGFLFLGVRREMRGRLIPAETTLAVLTVISIALAAGYLRP